MKIPDYFTEFLKYFSLISKYLLRGILKPKSRYLII